MSNEIIIIICLIIIIIICLDIARCLFTYSSYLSLLIMVLCSLSRSGESKIYNAKVPVDLQSYHTLYLFVLDE